VSAVLGVAALLFVLAPPSTQPALPDECRNLQVAGIEITDELALGPLEVDLHERCAAAAATPSTGAAPSPLAGKTSPVSATPSVPPTSGSSSTKPSTSAPKTPPVPKAAPVPQPESNPVSPAKARALAKADGTEKKRRWALVTLLLVVGTGVVMHRRSA
jgi:hypothetical protein